MFFSIVALFFLSVYLQSCEIRLSALWERTQFIL